mgnify:FL=1
MVKKCRFFGTFRMIPSEQPLRNGSSVLYLLHDRHAIDYGSKLAIVDQRRLTLLGPLEPSVCESLREKVYAPLLGAQHLDRLPVGGTEEMDGVLLWTACQDEQALDAIPHVRRARIEIYLLGLFNRQHGTSLL